MSTNGSALGARAGFARVALEVPDDLDMCGYGPMASKGKHADDPLHASALYLRGAGVGETPGEEVVFVAVDLHSASTWVLHHVGKRLEAEGLGEDRIVLAGTHTHTAPGRFHGNSFYDTFLQGIELSPWKRFDEDLAIALVENITAAVGAAKRAAAPAEIGVATAAVWTQHANRSLAAFAENADADRWHEAGFPGHGAPPDLEPEHRAVDPRARVIAAFSPDGALIGAFATFGCHATSLGADWQHYGRDWPGVAVDEAERALGVGPAVALAMSAAGDASPLSPSSLRPGGEPEKEQGAALRDARGKAVGAALVSAIEKARDARAPIAIDVRSALWEPAAARKWSVGWPTLGGAEDARSDNGKKGTKKYQEGYRRLRAKNDEQYPKARVRILSAFKWVCRLSPYHRLHRVELGGHVVATVPGEPTAMFASRLERRLSSSLGAESAQVVAYAGDYAGYFTTAEEYAAQHYEGSTTVYGHPSSESLCAAHGGMTKERVVATDPLFPIATQREMEDALEAAMKQLSAGPAITDEDGEATTVMFHRDVEDLERVGLRALADGREIAPAGTPLCFGRGLWLATFEQVVDDPSQFVLVYGDAEATSLPLQAMKP